MCVDFKNFLKLNNILQGKFLCKKDSEAESKFLCTGK